MGAIVWWSEGYSYVGLWVRLFTILPAVVGLGQGLLLRSSWLERSSRYCDVTFGSALCSAVMASSGWVLRLLRCNAVIDSWDEGLGWRFSCEARQSWFCVGWH